MDEFKKYIQNHSEELDTDEPSENVWKQVRNKTSKVNTSVSIVMYTRMAMAVCLIALAGFGIRYIFFSNNHSNNTLIAKVNVQRSSIDTIQNLPLPIERNEPPLIAGIHKFKVNKTTKNDENKVMGSADQSALSHLESSFTQVINLQKARISSIPMNAESADYFNDFKKQIQQMEIDEKVIKSDIARRGMNDGLLNQLINVYQQKLNVLKQLQTEMNKTNNRYKQNHNPVDSIKTYFLNL